MSHIDGTAPEPVNDARLMLRDGRVLAWCEYGQREGRSVLQFQGTPGSRYSRHAKQEAYLDLGVRVIVADRPGYGASTRLPGRGMTVVADDAVALLDHLGLDRVHVVGGSGGGPLALAFAALHLERVRAATVVVGAAPLLEEDISGMIGLNRAGWYAARDGWEALHRLLAPVREELLRDPIAGLRHAMQSAPAVDQAVMEDPDWQRMIAEDVREALRPGVDGWVDEAMALRSSWDFDPQAIGCSVTWWHGEHAANVPLSAVGRLTATMRGTELRVWTVAGHLESYHRHDEILTELLSR